VFKLEASLCLEAESMQDALRRLSTHFKRCADGNRSDLPLPGSTSSIDLVQEKEECSSQND
jgi:hypothetical protein